MEVAADEYKSSVSAASLTAIEQFMVSKHSRMVVKTGIVSICANIRIRLPQMPARKGISLATGFQGKTPNPVVFAKQEIYQGIDLAFLAE
ncbi:MAG: hypothetical protein LBB60_11505 [Desulfovibrio sp.]|nr:hypothetical protein [Desulfovibrio sp.]